MEPLFGLDQQTMFKLNALLLLVFAAAFSFAGLGQKDRRYWVYLVASNVVFALAFALFSRQINGTPADLMVPNACLVIGLGLRWQAIRTFFGHRSSATWFLALSIFIALALLFSPVLGTGLVFGMTNAVIAAQILAIMVSLIREKEALPSRWGPVFAYGAVAASSVLRVLQGLILDQGMESLLPADIFLDLNLIAAAIHVSASGAFSLSLAYERSVAGLRQLALRDALTGLYNRQSIEALTEIIGHRQDRSQTALVLLDIDHFKSVNDIHGHVAGDEAIRHCADVLNRVFGQHEFIARIGGEEFVVLLPGRDADNAVLLAEDMRSTLEHTPLVFKGKTIALTASLGIATSLEPVDATTFSQLLERADLCLYRAKLNGRNRIEVEGREATARSGTTPEISVPPLAPGEPPSLESAQSSRSFAVQR